MSQAIIPRTSTIDLVDGECPHGMSDPLWCGQCRRHRTGGVRIQVPVDGGRCKNCGVYLHKGDIITLVDKHTICQDCA